MSDLLGRLVGLDLDPGLEGFAKVRRLGSAVLHLLAVASGWFTACVEERGRLWDLAAASLLVREAGGVVLGRDGKALERFAVDRAPYAPIGCIAGAPIAVRRLLPILRKGPWKDQRARARTSATPPARKRKATRTAIPVRARSARSRAR